MLICPPILIAVGNAIASIGVSITAGGAAITAAGTAALASGTVIGAIAGTVAAVVGSAVTLVGGIVTAVGVGLAAVGTFVTEAVASVGLAAPAPVVPAGTSGFTAATQAAYTPLVANSSTFGVALETAAQVPYVEALMSAPLQPGVSTAAAAAFGTTNTFSLVPTAMAPVVSTVATPAAGFTDVLTLANAKKALELGSLATSAAAFFTKPDAPVDPWDDVKTNRDIDYSYRIDPTAFRKTYMTPEYESGTFRGDNIETAERYAKRVAYSGSEQARLIKATAARVAAAMRPGSVNFQTS